MKYFLAIWLTLSINTHALAMNCSNPPSNISDQFVYGITFVQIFLGSLQIALSFVPFITDYIFYNMSHSQRVVDREKELKELQKEHE